LFPVKEATKRTLTFFTSKDLSLLVPNDTTQPLRTPAQFPVTMQTYFQIMTDVDVVGDENIHKCSKPCIFY
jgi:hypothetical protein